MFNSSGKILVFLSLVMLEFLVEISSGERYVDLSYSIGSKTVLWPTHRRLARTAEISGYDQNGQWSASSSISMSEHTSTHMDSPYHVFPGGWKLSDVPTNRLFGVTGVMIDMSSKIVQKNNEKPNYVITKEDLIEWEFKNGRIPPKSLVLVRTGWDAKWGSPSDFLGNKDKCCSFPGLGLTGAKLLAERNVYGVGIDVVSIDVGFTNVYPAHTFLGSRNIYMLENVANLKILPPRGYTLSVFPIRFDKSTGSPARVFAIFK